MIAKSTWLVALIAQCPHYHGMQCRSQLLKYLCVQEMISSSALRNSSGLQRLAGRTVAKPNARTVQTKARPLLLSRD